jgi:hypothetical protein
MKGRDRKGNKYAKHKVINPPACVSKTIGQFLKNHLQPWICHFQGGFIKETRC